MLHRPADSRLLSNLLSREKDYVKTLHAQLEYEQASLASFSAYAAASPPPASRAIAAVAGALVGANESLRGYVFAVEEWCEQLKLLKEMENEVGNILRDREILVDRLIKASRTKDSKRRSLISSNSAGNSPTNSIFASSSSTALEQLAFSNSKLNLAQNELQGCETHLSEREKELAVMRETTIVKGLKGRCKALSECGRKWEEMGREAIKSLDELKFGHDEHDPQSPYRPTSSDLSSLAPSQSASQIFIADLDVSSQGHSSGIGYNKPLPEADIRHDTTQYVLSLPPAHAISEQDHYIPPQLNERVQPHVEEDIGGSSDEDVTDEQMYEVRENSPFSNHSTSGAIQQGRKSNSTVRLPLKKQKRSDSDVVESPFPASISAPLPVNPSMLSRAQANKIDPLGTLNRDYSYSSTPHDSPRQRKRSTFLGLGAITGLFHRRGRASSLSSVPGTGAPPTSRALTGTRGGHWYTRTGQNLKRAEKRDDSSDDDSVRRGVGVSDTAVDYEALRWKSIIESKALPSPTPARRADGASTSGRTGTSPVRAGTEGKKKLKKAMNPAHRKHASAVDVVAGTSTSDSPGKASTKSDGKKPTEKQSKETGLETLRMPIPAHLLTNGATSGSSASVTRSSTLTSQASSTKRTASLDITAPSEIDGKRHGGIFLDDSPAARAHAAGPAETPRKARHVRTHSYTNVTPPTHRGQVSLMSIVEDVSQRNRKGWSQTDPSRGLFEVKAPNSIASSTLFDELPQQQQTPTPNGRVPPMAASASTPNAAFQRRESPQRGKTDKAGKRRTLTNATQNADLRRLSTISASSSEPSLPLKNMTIITPEHSSTVRKAPLRSAMRTHSPSPVSQTSSPTRSASPVRFASDGASNNVIPPPQPTEQSPAAAPSQFSPTGVTYKDDDATSTLSSISDYETGQEEFDSATETEDAPPPPPPHDDNMDMHTPPGRRRLPNGLVSGMKNGGTQVSTSSGGTATPPSRRKSVRVSLQPTFSPTPPATYEFEGDHSPWSSSTKDNPHQQHRNNSSNAWNSRIDHSDTVWDDSSEEDEEYSRARKMLHQASKKLEKAAHIGFLK